MSRVTRHVVGEVEIEVEEHGQGDRPFVLVHGFTGSRDDWKEQMAPLARLGRTIAVDQRGHGGSTNTGDATSYTFDRLAADLLGLLDALDVARCDLLGHSMGGMVALRAVLAAPERFGSLVLMDTAAGPIPFMPKSVLDGAAGLARAQGTAALAPLMRSQAGSASRPKAAAACEARMGSDEFWRRIETKLGQMDPEAFAAFGSQFAEDPGVEDRLGEISCPTLVLVGEQDSVFVEERHGSSLPEFRGPSRSRSRTRTTALSSRIPTAG